MDLLHLEHIPAVAEEGTFEQFNRARWAPSQPAGTATARNPVLRALPHRVKNVS